MSFRPNWPKSSHPSIYIYIVIHFGRQAGHVTTETKTWAASTAGPGEAAVETDADQLHRPVPIFGRMVMLCPSS